MPSDSISSIETGAAAEAAALQAAGVHTMTGLIEAARTAQQRALLSQATGVTPARLLELVNLADALRIKARGKSVAGLLRAAGRR